MSCPTPHEKSYVTFVAAIFFARADGLRAYKCRCGQFHLSKLPKAGKRMGVAR